MKKTLLGAAIITVAMLIPVAATPAMAATDVELDHCNLGFAHDFTVTETAVTVVAEKSQLRFGTDGSLSRDGKAIALSSEEQQLVQRYSQQLQSFIPELLTLVADSLRLVGKMLGEAFAEVFGEDSEAAATIQAAVASAEQRAARGFKSSDGVYTVTSDGIDTVDDIFGAEFESAVDEAVEASMSSVLSMLGDSLFSGDGSFSERMEAFGRRMEAFGESVDKNMAGRGEMIKAQAQTLCHKAESIKVLELQLSSQIAELAAYRLLVEPTVAP